MARAVSELESARAMRRSPTTVVTVMAELRRTSRASMLPSRLHRMEMEREESGGAAVPETFASECGSAVASGAMAGG